ncbi:MAG: aminopeptidase P family protein [Hyphomicrobiales bacterium]|nr:aminopeptidase P family protein [Hyphomicrobiales bacterium]
MFQKFDAIADPAAGTRRLKALREELRGRGLIGFFVPHTDEHQNEYLPACAERLFWLTGFSGSAGCAVVLADRAAIFVDGRYTLQVRAQVDTDCFAPKNVGDETPYEWLQRRLSAGDRFGYDPKLHTVESAGKLEAACGAADASLVACETNPIDAIWTDRPAPPLGPVVLHPSSLAGESAESKISRLSNRLGELRADAVILTRPDSIAWLFNIRGHDIAHTPVPLSFAIAFRADDRPPRLFIDGRKLGNETRSEISAHADIFEPAELGTALAELKGNEPVVRLDPVTVSQWFEHELSGGAARIQHGPDPCMAMKSRKNEVEINGARAAHLRDGVSLARFLAWLDREAPLGGVDEIKAVERLEALRAETGKLKDISFDTISGTGPNGAVVHYRVTRASNRRLEPDTLYLIDSGAQYEDGTTDVTRTVAIGRPSDEMRDRYTRVLKGHIAVATARFPVGTTGTQLDPFARRALWEAGVDYDHGTGHGVGSFLSVHEGPARIAKVQTVALEPGMIISNEPGYYKSGAYGIRIENLVLVRSAVEVEGGERPLLSFETLTLVPIDQRPIAPELLTVEEIQWLNAYHAGVREALSPHLGADDRAWLEQATRPLKG